ncbi:MAG TPA: hemolysin family protein [Thermoleophilaceae bacterium]|nr:hemolysin family protein [Thermoleophilaceae bacterium]
MTELLLLLGVAVLVAANGFFVAAEFALVRARESRLEQLRDEGAAGAGLALAQIERIDEYLSACQLGITMASLGIGFMGEPAIASLLEDALGDALPHGVTLAISIGIAYLITTALHITLGEQVPKIYSIVHAEGTARRTARGLQWFSKGFSPLIWLLNSASNWMLRLVGVDPRVEFEEATSSEDLKLLIARSAHGGKLDPGEAGMLSGVFHLHEQEARQVMTPIPAVVTVDMSENVETALRRCVDSGHTRLVVTEEDNTDRIKGIVHNNSLARLLMTEGSDASIEPCVKDALIVPETKPLDDLLADLQRERASMAVVVDEYGRTAGIVSVEDIIEEVVGEIADETDPAVAGVRRLANGDWWVRGHVPITDLADYGLDLPADSDAYNSVGGFVFGELGRLPKRGDMVRANGYSLRVESVRENRVEAVRIRDHGRPEGAERGEGAPPRPVEQAASTPRGQAGPAAPEGPPEEPRAEQG